MPFQSSQPSRALRLFVGIAPPPPVQAALREWSDSLRGTLPFQKWTHPADVHVTLAFLGDASAETAGGLAQTLRELARTAAPLALRLERLGVFGAPAAPSVLWAGADGDLEALSQLQREVEGACARHGFAAEARPYRPHVTLARRYSGAGPFRRAALAEAPPPSGGWPEWRVQDIVLYRSHLGRQPSYEPLHAFPLEGRAAAAPQA